MQQKMSDSTEDFLIEIEHLCEDRVQGIVSYINTIRKMNKLLSANTHLDFVIKLQKLKLWNQKMSNGKLLIP